MLGPLRCTTKKCSQKLPPKTAKKSPNSVFPGSLHHIDCLQISCLILPHPNWSTKAWVMMLGCLPNLLFDLSSWDTSLTRSHRFPIRSILSHPPSTSPFGEIHWESKQPTETTNRNLLVRMIERKQASITGKGRKNLSLGKNPWTSKRPLKRTTKVNHHFILTAILTGHSDLELQYVSPVAMPPPEIVQLCQRKRALRGTIANGLFMSVEVSKQKSNNQQIWETKVDLKITSARSGEEGILLSSVSQFRNGLLKLFYKMRFPGNHPDFMSIPPLPFTNDNNPQVFRKTARKLPICISMCIFCS